MQLLVTFIVANIINVIFGTIKTITTVKANKYVAALINAVNYAFNVYIVVLTVSELPLAQKCVIVGLCNLIGVFVVKLVEEKARKDKLWRIDFTLNSEYLEEADKRLEEYSVPHNYITNIGKNTLFTCYCYTKEQTGFVKEIMSIYKAKYFVTEGVNS